MPIDYSKYPPNWKERRERILERAEHKCEVCGVPNYAVGWRDYEGKFHSVYEDYSGKNLKGEPTYNDAREIQKEYDETVIVIVLTIAHLDHDEENWDVKDDRLRALCQQCHLRYDAPEKARRQKAKKAIGDLFE